MNMPEASFLTRQQEFSTEDDCLKYLHKFSAK
jgi:hypothetical protein